MTNMKKRWRERSACYKLVEAEPIFQTAWLVKDDVGASQAKALCAECPVRLDCLVDALGDPEAQGLRAGFYFDSGVVSRQDARAIMNEVGIRPFTAQRQNRTRIPSPVP